ncbi:MAG: hypothetical protein Q9195_009524 [Heterodermia aff. obscurata]
MAELRGKVDVFCRISEDAEKCQEPLGPNELGIFVNKELDKYRREYPLMQNLTPLDYFTFWVKRSAEQRIQELEEPVPPDEQFWKAVYDYDPFKLAPNTHSDLSKYLAMKNLDSIPLGMYGGYAKLELICRSGALPNTETSENRTKLRCAATNSGAISYPYARPSEFEDEEYRVQDSQDQRLRRFISLGSVIHVRSDGNWEYTGHALVIDMGEGRSRQPWFVLASEWERDIEDAEGSFYDRAPAQVLINDMFQFGVLGDDINRTAVGMVEPMIKSELHVLQQFGPEFNFLVKSDPPATAYHPDPTRGPDLAHIMTWYWDPVREVEVCYSKDGREYMAYDPKTTYYTYPQTHRHSVAGDFERLSDQETDDDV